MTDLTPQALRALAARIANNPRYGTRARLVTRAILEAEAAQAERGEQ